VVVVGKTVGLGGGSGLGFGGSEMGLDGLAQLNPVAQNQLGFGSSTRLKTGSSKWSNHQSKKWAGLELELELGLKERKRDSYKKKEKKGKKGLKKNYREMGFVKES
jgi:hypothetical protein